MISYARTDTGRVRKMNQDSIFASSEPVGMLPNLFIVADGMGGHKAGDYASRFVVEQIVSMAGEFHHMDTVMFLRKAIEEVNSRLYDESLRNPDFEGMGTTLVLAVVENDTMYVANVGDSRLYLLRDNLEQITRDHSLVEEMVSLGKMERGSESYKSQKNIITRAVGIIPYVEVDFFEVPLQECDCVLMCSDGLTNMVGDDGISKILKTTDTLEEKTESLIAKANENGGKDNISVILVEPQISEVRV
ncbi:MAG: Stp1/IreP family PP2C-type Ser/Thr phosphatase [Lachnospiraceae bacterium]|nr:Stp1/IreP family PP2C-type Ser/Thr phosphatase [Lachnospiraceae bacterium]